MKDEVEQPPNASKPFTNNRIVYVQQHKKNCSAIMIDDCTFVVCLYPARARDYDIDIVWRGAARCGAAVQCDNLRTNSIDPIGGLDRYTRRRGRGAARRCDVLRACARDRYPIPSKVRNFESKKLAFSFLSPPNKKPRK